MRDPNAKPKRNANYLGGAIALAGVAMLFTDSMTGRAFGLLLLFFGWAVGEWG